MKINKLIATSLMLPWLASCAQDAGDKQILGTMIGAAGGGLAGAQIGGGSGKLAATAAGVLLGAMVGSEVGKSLDRADRLYRNQTRQRALETNRTGVKSNWVNPDSGNSGTITPQPAIENASGGYCREFQETVTIGGEQETAYGTACRQPDGTWKITST
jgi:surface antigen